VEPTDNEPERDPVAGTPRAERRVVEGAPAGPIETSEMMSDNPGWRASQLVYLFFGIIDGLLLIRLVLKLLAANPHSPFASWVYSFTDFFLMPFRNLLPTIGNEQSVLEMSVVIAILVYALLGWALERFVGVVFYRNVTVSRRSGRYRPGPY
jgi:uncharacterized protein YggT (Ycf19 family)